MKQQIDTEKMGVDPDEGVGVRPTTAESKHADKCDMPDWLRGEGSRRKNLAAHHKNLLESFIQESQSGATPVFENAGDYIGRIYVDTFDRNIKTDYTLTDRATLAWAQLKGQAAGLPGCTKYKDCEEQTREGIDMRLLRERIKTLRADFANKYAQAKQLRADSGTMLQRYAQQRLEYHTTMVQTADDAQTMNESLSIMHAKLEAAKAEGSDRALTTDRRKDICIEAGSLQNTMDMTELARNDLAEKCRHNKNLMMVYTILHASMKQQYQCVNTMVNALVERGTHINELLSGYATGNNLATITKFRNELAQCHLLRGRLTALDNEYQQRMAEFTGVTKLQDKDLQSAYLSVVNQSEKLHDSSEQEFRKQYNDVLQKVFGIPAPASTS